MRSGSAELGWRDPELSPERRSEVAVTRVSEGERDVGEIAAAAAKVAQCDAQTQRMPILGDRQDRSRAGTRGKR